MSSTGPNTDHPILHVDLLDLVSKLGGEVVGDNQFLCPGPDHSSDDRSLSITVEPSAPDGYLVHSHAADDWRACKALVNAAIRDLPKGERRTFAERPPAAAPEDRPTFKWAKRFWDASVPVADTPAYFYLCRARGLNLETLPPTLRFNGDVSGRPALIAAITNVEDWLQGFQITALRDDGSWKADMPKPRRCYGTVKGGAIRLGPPGPPGAALLVAEGVESAMTAMLLDDQRRPAWAAISAGNLRNDMALPLAVRSVLIIPDGDAALTGQTAAQEAAQRWRRDARTKGAHREVSIVEPPTRPDAKGFDLNDLHMERLGLRRPEPSEAM